ncbi:MAG: carboxypeptidase regulatory-like domain-containing protein [Planctomycetes bacterium]|nr:carboxypeptidase regulatory-like domain-containing protein [Planctomycetota bacterium]
MKLRCLAIAIVVLLATPAPPATTQEGGAASLRLQLRSRTTDVPVALAEVRVNDGAVLRTDEKGILEPDLPAGAAVRLAAAGHVPVEFRLPRRPPEGHAPVVIRLPPCAGVRGRVNEAHGRPISGASVCARLSESVLRDPVDARGRTVRVERSWTTTADAEGRYRLDGLPAGVEFRMEAQPGGDRPPIRRRRPIVLEAGESRYVLLHPPPGFTVEGRVVDASDRPVPFASVRVHSRFAVLERDSRKERTVQADAAGCFRLVDLPFADFVIADQFVLAAAPSEQTRAAGFAFPPTRTKLEVPLDTETVEATIRVHCGLFVAGQVLGPDDTPLPNVPVWCDKKPEVAARTAADGTFRLGPLGPGTHCVRANGFPVDTSEGAPAFESAATGDAGGAAIVIRVPAAGGFEGRMIDAVTGELIHEKVFAVLSALGLPDGSSVNLMPRRYSFDKGTVSVCGLPPGRYELVARDRDGTSGAILQDILIAPGETVRGLEFRIQAGGQIRITFDATWAGFKRAMCHVSTPAGTWISLAHVDTLQSATINALAGKMHLEVWAMRHIHGKAGEEWETDVEIPSRGVVDVHVPPPSPEHE